MHVDGVSILISTACQLLPLVCVFWQKPGGNLGIFGPHHGASVAACSRKYVEQKFVGLKRVIAFMNWIRLPVVNAGAHIKMQFFYLIR